MTDTNKLAQAILDYRSKMDFVGPTVDDDIRRAISRYGADAVKASVRKQTAKKAGRKKLPVWPELMPIIESDARRWLETESLKGRRTNNSIAREISNREREHNRDTVHRRIMGRLSEERDQRTAIQAMIISKNEGPVVRHVAALKWLSQYDEWTAYAKNELDGLLQIVELYKQSYGSSPDDSITLSELKGKTNDFTKFIDPPAR